MDIIGSSDSFNLYTNCRKQASSKVRNTTSEKEVQLFLGLGSCSEVKRSESTGTLSKIRRYENKHPIVEAVQDVLLLQYMTALGIPPTNFINYRLTRSFSVRAQNLDLVNSGEWVEYRDSEQGVSFKVNA